MGGIVFGPHRHKRIAFCGKFGGARLGRLKEGLGRCKQKHISAEQTEKWTGRMRVWTAQA